MKHFAGNVVYQATGMLEKNRHLLAIEAIQVLRKSCNKTVRALFQCPVTKTGNLYSQVILITLGLLSLYDNCSKTKRLLNNIHYIYLTLGLVYWISWTCITISRSADSSYVFQTFTGRVVTSNGL